jgi:catechol 2,3-dioxygenase-like lactoylglutathione lyase family enzyme
MSLVAGAHHITFLCDDLDRLTGFYQRVFDAPKTLDMTEEGVRHVFIEVGPTTVLHPFQILAGPPLPPAPGEMFQRGRLDHFALLAPS